MADDKEFTEGGSEIIRHQPRTSDFEAATSDSEAIALIESHIAKHVGAPDAVFHEIVSDLVHIDVHVVEPTRERNFYTLVTSGMSDRPMNAPPGAEEYRYCELVISLPPNWPVGPDEFEDENNYWPVGWLKKLARLPHEYNSGLSASHTVPNGDPARPFAANTSFCCQLISVPLLFGEDFWRLPVNDEKTIHFYSMVPIYKEEMDFKLRRGYDALMEKLVGKNVSELIDVKRPNVAKKRFGIF